MELFNAAKDGKEKAVRTLLSQGVDVNWENDVGATALDCAVLAGNEKTVALLLDAKAQVNHVQASSKTMALHRACEASKLKVVSALIQAGAIVNVMSESGTPLIKSAMQGDAKIVKALLEAGADLAPQFMGKTALEWAEAERKKDCVRLLEVAVSQPRDPLAVIYQAASRGNATQLGQLLAHAGLSADRRASEAFADASTGAMAGNGLAWKDSSGQTALHMAAAGGSRECIELLLRARAHVEDRQNWGMTPLAMASANNKAACIKLLCESGAVVNAPDDNGVTPLIKSSIAGHGEAVKMLLELNADANLKYLNKTALQWAKEEGRPMDLQKLLRQHTTSVP